MGMTRGKTMTIAELQEKTKISRGRLRELIKVFARIKLLIVEDDKVNCEDIKVTMSLLKGVPEELTKAIEKEERELNKFFGNMQNYVDKVKENKKLREFCFVEIEDLEKMLKTKEKDMKFVIIKKSEGATIESKKEDDMHKIGITNVSDDAKVYKFNHPDASNNDQEKK